MMSPDLKTINKILFVLLLISIITFIVLCLKVGQEKPQASNKKDFEIYLSKQQSKIDSVLSKIQVLESSKTTFYREYNKTNLKYDTIKIVIDSMPGINGTKLLFSISRELTNKGIE